MAPDRQDKMLKMTAGFVLAALRDSPYGTEYASPLRLLRPRGTAILSILRDGFSDSPHHRANDLQEPFNSS
jgi:hypothetical protein